MRWLRVLLMLVALLASPMAGLALSAASLADCCGGAMCPMHRGQESPRQKMPGQANPPQGTCMCGPSQQAQQSVPNLAPQAILTFHPILSWPLKTQENLAFGTAPVLIRPVAPLDQPPRL
jgi:hypothetical protein